MKKAYKLNYHSFIDVITNSSTEMFINTDQKVVQFIKSLFKDEKLENFEIKILTYKEYYKEQDLEYIKDAYPEDFKIYKDLKDDDEILVINVESGAVDGAIETIMNKLNFISIYD